MRRRMMMGKGLPYDAEVEYLESVGNCVINTNYIPTGDDIRIQTKVLYNGYTKNAGWIPWFAAYTNEQSNTYRIIRNNNSSLNIYLFNGAVAGGGGISFRVATGTIYNIDLNRNRYTINTSSGNLSNVKGTENSSNLSLFNPIFKGAFFYFKLWKNDVLMLDLIPVRKGTTGYMYDNVSGELFGNAGTGSFIVGPDRVNP